MSILSKGVDAASAVDDIGQNCIHFVVCSSVAVAVGNHKDAPRPPPAADGDSASVDVLDRQTALIQYLVQVQSTFKLIGWPTSVGRFT